MGHACIIPSLPSNTDDTSSVNPSKLRFSLATLEIKQKRSVISREHITQAHPIQAFHHLPLKMPPQYATYPSLSQKVVLVTGGAEGVGASTVSAFAAQGSRTIILDISSSSATSLIETIQKAGHSAPDFHQCDVTDLTRLKEVVDAVLAKYGKVDVLINNAASAGGSARKGTEDVDAENWDFGVNVNLRHQFFLTKWLVPKMREQHSGSVVNMGSISWRIPSVGCECF